MGSLLLGRSLAHGLGTVAKIGRGRPLRLCRFRERGRAPEADLLPAPLLALNRLLVKRADQAGNADVAALPSHSALGSGPFTFRGCSECSEVRILGLRWKELQWLGGSVILGEINPTDHILTGPLPGKEDPDSMTE